jgi:hypothetical protein
MQLADESGTHFEDDSRQALSAVLREDCALEYVIFSCYRMAMPGVHRGHDTQSLRLLFFAGLLAAGTHVLAMAAQSSESRRKGVGRADSIDA